MSVLTAVYVILGGYKATAMNDFIQGIIMLFGIVAVIVAVLNAQGGLATAVDKLAQLPSDADPTVNGGFASWFGPDPWGLLGVVILTSLGTMGLPQMVFSHSSSLAAATSSVASADSTTPSLPPMAR